MNKKARIEKRRAAYKHAWKEACAHDGFHHDIGASVIFSFGNPWVPVMYYTVRQLRKEIKGQ